MIVQHDPFVGAVNEGKPARYVRTSTRNGRE